MSWVRDTKLTWTQRLAVKVVRTGPMPRHIAFIMDGNRRFSRKAQLESVGAGHACGFDKLAEALQWCLELGIEEVTVYAFSIENFKRSRSEVDTLLELAREKFARLMEEKDQLHERGICIRMVGNWSLLPLDLQKSMAAATLLTYGNTRAVLNVAFAYTSRDEMTESVVAVVDGVQRGELEPCDISDELLRRCMYTGASRDPDLLVRTSGESRLSDFLLWQASASVIYFTQTLWPEITIWHLIAGVFYYQRHHRTAIDIRDTLHHYSLKDECIKLLPVNHPAADGGGSIDTISRNKVSATIATDSIDANVQRVQQFLRNFDKRKYERLIGLSAMRLQ